MKEKIKAFTVKHSELWKMIKFMFTGASTSILQLAVHAVCFYFIFASFENRAVDARIFAGLGTQDMDLRATLTYLTENIIGYGAAFIMNRKMTFKSDANPVVSALLYILMVVATIYINTFLGTAVTSWLEASGYFNVLTNMLTSLVLMTLPIVWTYPFQRFVVHRRKKPAADGDKAED